MENQSLSKNLVYQRKLKGYTQEELAEKTSVTVRTIQRIEKGEVNPHLQTVKLLAVALEIEVDSLLNLENPKEEAIQKKWLLLLHGTPLLGFVLPLFNVLIPLFIWIHKREDNPLYERHGRAIVNFQITMTLLFALAFIALVTVQGYGFFFFISVIPFVVIVILGNIISVLNTQKCYYPLAIPFLRAKKSTVSKAMAILCIVCLFDLAGYGPVSSQTITRLDGSVINSDSLTVKIEQLVRDAHVHGMAVTVFNESQAIYQHTFGYKNFEALTPLSGSTNMYGASLSKAVFSILVMRLVEEGIIDLDTPLETYLPKKIYEYEPLTKWHDNFSDLKADTLYQQVTARMCLTHTAGFPNWRWNESDQKLRVKFEPGSLYSYSGEGFVYLQVVLEKLLGKNLEDLAQEYVFTPLNMNRSSYKWDPAFQQNFAYGHNASGTLYPKDTDNEPRAGSTLETTPEDYTRFLETVLQKKILKEESWAELFRTQIRIYSVKQFDPAAGVDSTLYDHLKLGYGLGWGILETPHGIGSFKEGHGDGFQHYSILFPDAGKGILIMTNSDNGESIFKELLEVAIGDTYTPWKWQNNYIPYNYQE